MLITNHVLSGALVGVAAQGPARAVGAGFVSHFVLDAVPHFGVDESRFLPVAVADGLLGLATIAGIARRTPPALRPRVAAGIAGACVPDLDKPARLFVGRSPFPGWFDEAHQRIQPESPRRWPVEVVGAAAFGALLVRALSKDVGGVGPPSARRRAGGPVRTAARLWRR